MTMSDPDDEEEESSNPMDYIWLTKAVRPKGRTIQSDER